MEYVRKQIGEFEVFEICGDFIISKIDKIAEEYSALINDGKYKFIFDLRKVDFIDSSGFGAIVEGVNNVLEHKEKIRICINPSNVTVKKIFGYFKIDYVIEYYSSLDDALKGINMLENIN